jgi:hypothetical protein
MLALVRMGRCSASESTIRTITDSVCLKAELTQVKGKEREK